MTSTDADTHRAKPGYRWRIAMRCSGERKEAAPPCSCPCHVADAPCPSSWYCDKCYRGLMRITSRQDAEQVPYSHEQAIADGTTNPQPYMVDIPDYYFLTCGNTLDDAAPRRHFKTSGAAKKAAAKLNDEDAIASLKVPKTHRERFNRYRALHTHLGWWWYDGENHPLTRFPRKPGRYAVETWSDDGSYWFHHESLDDVRSEIEDGDVSRVVDLDTGEDVPFTRSVHVAIA